jgi:hypothetical protein
VGLSEKMMYCVYQWLIAEKELLCLFEKKVMCFSVKRINVFI